jgi:ribosomal protein L11 methyltransferase
MPWLELSLPCAETDQARYENALEDLGALSVTLVDADADTGNERAILEPGVGQTPLWSALVLTALFPVDTDALVLLAALEAFDPGLDWTRAGFRTVQDEDWERAWLDQFKPMRFGARTWIVPWNHELPAEARAADAAVVRLDPGWPSVRAPIRPPRCACAGWTAGHAGPAAGAHRARLRLRFGHPRAGRAQARCRAGHRRGQRPAGTGRHRRQRRAQRRAATSAAYLPDDEPAGTYPVVVANILASALDALAETLAARVAPGGRIALSGILHGRKASCSNAMRPGSTNCAPSRTATGCASTACAADTLGSARD